MAYNVKGKTYTDHPLMDEICYNCKLILKSIVVKNDILAMQKETENSLNNAEMFFLMHDKSYIDFNTFNFTKEIYKAFGYNDIETKFCLENRIHVPESDRKALTDFANEYFKNNFEEENDYYRMLMGLPPFNSGEEYYIWLTSSDIPSNYSKQVFLNVPLHKQPIELLNLLYENGTIDNLRKIYIGSNYSYMLYLGNRSIDLYNARKAAKWDILYMPNVYYLVRDKFTEYYKINKELYINRSYQEFFSQSGEYYDQMMILILLAETFANMITSTPEWYIKRDIFDLRSCKYFLDASGVEYFKTIPLRYQIRIVKNLNKLIKYKSSNQNASDIIDIFASPNTKIHKYWLYKKIDPTKNNGYDLEFIASDYNDSYDNYIKDSKYRTPYDDITLQDKYWDGEDTHENVKNNTMDLKFTIQGTKYMSIEYQVSMKDWIYQTEYMLGLILDSYLYNSMSDIKIAIPSIDDNATFKLADLFLFLVILSNSFYRTDISSTETLIRVPEDLSEGKKPKVNEKFYDWKKKYFPEMFIQKNGRIHGFNSTLNKDSLIKDLEKRHSHLRFGMPDNDGQNALNDSQYKERADKWLSDLGIFDYIVPNNTVTSIEDLVNVYETNTKVYEKVREAIIHSETQDDKKYLEYIYQELFTRPFDTDLYTRVLNGEIKRYKDLVNILQERDYILYDIFMSIMGESNLESKQDIIRNIMNDIVDTLDYYLSGDGLNYLYSFVSIESFGAKVKYIYLMMQFFKSYKVYFLDPYYTIQGNDEFENSVRPSDKLNEYRITNYKWDKSHVADAIGAISNTRYMKDLGETEMFEVADIFAHYDPDPLMDFDLDGTTAEKGELETVTDIDCGTADPKSTPHYTTFNGGFSHLGVVNIHDMDGGNADEEFADYHSIDGGYAFNYDDIFQTSISKLYSYNVDGGAAGRDEFISNTLHLKLIGTELQGNVRVSSKTKLIEIKEDGIFMSNKAFATNSEFLTNQETINYLIDNINIDSKTTLSDLETIVDEKYRYNRIKSVLDPITADMEYVNEMMYNNRFVTNIKEYVDELVKVFRDRFINDPRINPYSWEEL